jgi:hypothetical protein
MKNKYTCKYTIWVYPDKDIRKVISDIINRTVWMIDDSDFLEECDSWIAAGEFTAQKIGISENISTYYKYWIIVLFEEYLCSQIEKSNERIKVSIASDSGQDIVITVSHEDFKEKLMFLQEVKEYYKSRVIDFEKDDNEDD